MKTTQAASPIARAQSSVRPAIIRASEAHQILGVGRTKFWEFRSRPDFPRPVLIGSNAKGYLIREIEDWAASLPRG